MGGSPDGRLILVVDDADLPPETSAAALDAAVAHARTSRSLVVASGVTSALLTSFRGWVGEARRNRTGLLLIPQFTTDGDLLGCRLTKAECGEETPPGRGQLVTQGQLTPIQIALAAPGPEEQASRQPSVDRHTPGFPVRRSESRP